MKRERFQLFVLMRFCNPARMFPDSVVSFNPLSTNPAELQTKIKFLGSNIWLLKILSLLKFWVATRSDCNFSTRLRFLDVDPKGCNLYSTWYFYSTRNNPNSLEVNNTSSRPFAWRFHERYRRLWPFYSEKSLNTFLIRSETAWNIGRSGKVKNDQTVGRL